MTRVALERRGQLKQANAQEVAPAGAAIPAPIGDRIDPGWSEGTPPRTIGSSSMPRYYFDIYNDLDTIDEDGSEFADLDAAIASAIRGARSIAADHVMHGRLTRHDRIEILDCDRKLLRTIRFDEAVTISP